MKLQLMIVISSLKGKYSHFKNWYILFLWFRTVQKSQWTWKILERLQRQWIMKDFLAETESTQRNVLIIWGHFLFQNWEHYNRIKLIWISNRKQTFCGSTKSVSYSLSVEQLQIYTLWHHKFETYFSAFWLWQRAAHVHQYWLKFSRQWK